MQGRHKTNKSPNSPTFSRRWSGVSYGTEVHGERCETCGGHLHRESDSKYCPRCDDFKAGVKGTPED